MSIRILLLNLAVCGQLLLGGCGPPYSSKSEWFAMGESKIEQGIDLAQYTHVAIYDSGTKGEDFDSASFNELIFADFFRLCGYKIVGEKVADDLPPGSVLGVRYRLARKTRGYWGYDATILLEDFTTDQTVFVAEGESTTLITRTSNPRGPSEELNNPNWKRFDQTQFSTLEIAIIKAFTELYLTVRPNQEDPTPKIEELF